MALHPDRLCWLQPVASAACHAVRGPGPTGVYTRNPPDPAACPQGMLFQDGLTGSAWGCLTYVDRCLRLLLLLFIPKPWTAEYSRPHAILDLGTLRLGFLVQLRITIAVRCEQAFSHFFIVFGNTIRKPASREP